METVLAIDAVINMLRMHIVDGDFDSKAQTDGDPRVAVAVKDIADGMVRLMESRHWAISVLMRSEKFTKFPFPPNASPDTICIVLKNPITSFLGDWPKNAKMYSHGGTLGLIAYVAFIDPQNAENNEVGLMLDLPTKVTSGGQGFIALNMSRTGNVRATSTEFFLYGNAAIQLAFGGTESTIGVIPGRGGAQCERVGAPVTQEYLNSHLGDLVAYMSDAAARLSDQSRTD